MLIVNYSNFILGYFFNVSFNSDSQKDSSIYDMLSGGDTYTFGSVVRSEGWV